MRQVPRSVVIVAVLAAVLVPLASAVNEPPTLTVPPDTTVEATGPAGAVFTYETAAADFRGRPLPVECDRPSGSTFPLGASVVTCSASHAGQTTTKRFTVTVADTTPPVLTVPPDKSLRTRSRTGVPVAYTATATDRVDGAVAPVCAPPSGSVFRGVTLVRCTATDRSANSSSAEFTITVAILRTVRRAALFSPPARALIFGPTMLAWRAVARARFYNVQVHRNGRKILSRWPLRPRFGLRASWRHEGRTYRLRPGVYTWFVWPAYGTKAVPRYGKLLGQSSFRVG